MSEHLDTRIRARKWQILTCNDSYARDCVPYTDEVDVDVPSKAGLETRR